MQNLFPPARWRNVCLALLILTMVIIVLGYASENTTYEYLALGTMAAAIGGTMAFWRCPRCRRMLPLNNMMHITRCPKCNADIQNYNGH